MLQTLSTKCVMVGSSTVGKTALVQMFTSDGRNFPKAYNMTFGVDLIVKTIAIPDSDYSVEMLIYDSSGKDLYIDFLPRCWHEPHMVLAVFDVTSQASLDAVSTWVALARNSMAQEHAVNNPGILYGNKADLIERRTVTPKAGLAVAEKLGLHYLEGSAKMNQGVEEPFFLLAHEWHKLFTEKQVSLPFLL